MTHCIDVSLSLWEHTGTKCDLWKRRMYSMFPFPEGYRSSIGGAEA